MILDKTQSRRAVTRRALLFAAIPAAAALVALAVLRPSVKAQAAPTASADATSTSSASATVPEGSSRLNFHFGRVAMNKSTDGQVEADTDPDLTISGTTLFAGVTDADKPGSPWWSATGALLPKPVYDTSAYHAENHVGNSSTHNVEFAFRLPAAAQGGITTDYKLPQSQGFSSQGEWPGKSQSDAGNTEGQIFASTSGARVVTAAFPPTLKKTSVQIGIAAGPWKTAVSNPNPSAGLSTNNGNQDFILGPAEQTAKGLVLTVTTNSKDDLRVIAVDAQGNELFPADHLGDSINGMDQITMHFSQPLSQIKAFRVETRPFQWIEFKDVALQPVK